MRWGYTIVTNWTRKAFLQTLEWVESRGELEEQLGCCNEAAGANWTPAGSLKIMRFRP